MKLRILLIYLLACFLNTSVSCAASSFVLGYSEFRPYIWNDNNVPKGIYVDIIKGALEERMGVPVVYRHLPTKRALHYLEKGELDGLIEVSTTERSRYSETGRVPVAMGLIGAFTYKNHPKTAGMADADTLEDLKGYRILTYLGDDWAKENLAGFDVDPGAADLSAALKKLNRKRGDLLLQIEQVARYNIRQLSYENDIVQLPTIGLRPISYHLLVSKKSAFTKILPQLDRTLTEMLNDGTINHIYKKYKEKAFVSKISSNKGVKIRFLHYGTGILPGVFKDIAATVNNKQQQYRLKPIHMDMESYKQAIKVMLFGGAPADMLLTWAGYRTQYLVNLGLIVPVDDIWESAGMEKMFPFSISRGMTYNGHKYAIPLSHHIVSIFYNRHIFEEYNVDIPRNWEEFIKAGEKFKSKGIIPVALGSKERWPASYWFDYLLVRTAGPAYRRKLLTGGASYTDPQVKRVFELWKALCDRDFFNKDCNELDYTDASELVYRGRAAMTLNGTWTIGDFENIYGQKGGEDFDFFVFPHIDPGVPDVLVGVMDVIVQAKAGKINQTQKMMCYFADPKIQMIFNAASGALIPNKKVPLSAYPPVLNKMAKVVSKIPDEVSVYDLSTPPGAAEIGLTAFKRFLENPDRYLTLLEQTDRKIKKAFQTHSPVK